MTSWHVLLNVSNISFHPFITQIKMIMLAFVISARWVSNDFLHFRNPVGFKYGKMTTRDHHISTSFCDNSCTRITDVLSSLDPIASSPETGELCSDSEKNDLKSTVAVNLDLEETKTVEIADLDKVSDICSDSTDTVGYLHPKKKRKYKHKHKSKRKRHKKKKSKQDFKYENCEYSPSYPSYTSAKIELSPKSHKKHKKMKKHEKWKKHHLHCSSPMKMRHSLKNA